ncbi:molybdopterin-dependent oxidoreductase [Novosphingobium sp. FSY-8]|uniref:Molybdopterin-dependent oxidoreductase n=1 Tax=Novosphingobium ovatum TaxID=1908523 RepID=A0ABW9XCE2_9SPHN|nr:molybdopterin cofactor-binding domain-containing protein [Novosphingobium ovatum]NBC36193.1 molybdopterin-dependent oxidoreductase [Novosphingobium ovatum]
MSEQRDVIALSTINRRAFLRGGGIGAGALVIAASLPGMLLPTDALADGPPPGAAPPPPQLGFGAMIAIARDGVVSFICPSSEMGQGTQETLARYVGEELDCDYARLKVLLPWADPLFVNPMMRRQMTANSATTVGYFTALRKAAAASRMLLVQVAAQRLGVAEGELTTANGVVRHAASGRSIGYGDLAEAAAKLPVPAQVPLRPASAWTIIGGSTPRKDLAAKVRGSAEFGIDVVRPGMLIGALALGPHPRAKVQATNLDKVRTMPGVTAIVPVEAGYAVLSPRFWQAKKAAEALELKVLSSPTAGLDDKGIDAAMERAFASVPPMEFPDFDFATMRPKEKRADRAAITAALAGAAKRVEATYDVPYVAHATMEPLTCSAHFADGQLTVRGPLQSPEAVRTELSQVLNIPFDKVRVEVTYLGGGFGRKWGVDFPVPAAQAAIATPGRWVKLIWTREQDIAMDQFRPAYRVRQTAGIGADGRLQVMHSRIAGQSINTYHHRKSPPGIADPTAAGMLIYGCYGIPQSLIEYHETKDLSVPVGFWRSVSASQNTFFAEAFLDEVARAAGKDPLAYRRAMLAGEPRILRVLDKAADMIGWSKPKPRGTGHGIAITYNEGHVCAEAVRVRVVKGKLTIEKIVAAFDCGPMIDPKGVESQISGGIVFGLQAAIWGEIPFAEGRPNVANFGEFRMPLLADIPPIEVALMPSGERPGNAGEAGTPPIAAALVNAIADAGGPRIRRLPIARMLEI